MQRYAAKLIALALLASVRWPSVYRRLLPLVSVVPTASPSYAAQASYMHVWTIASARATIGGPLRSDLLKRTSTRVVTLIITGSGMRSSNGIRADRRGG